jgi:hypothetical protein
MEDTQTTVTRKPRVARLNRRRYKEATAALKELIADKKQPPQRRLVAIQTLLGIYDRHDRTERQKSYRKDDGETSVNDTQTDSVNNTPPTTEEIVEKFLANLRAGN